MSLRKKFGPPQNLNLYFIFQNLGSNDSSKEILICLSLDYLNPHTSLSPHLSSISLSLSLSAYIYMACSSYKCFSRQPNALTSSQTALVLEQLNGSQLCSIYM